MAQDSCRIETHRRRVLVIGGGDTGLEVVRQLLDSVEVVVLDLEPEAVAARLGEASGGPGIQFLKGDGASPLALADAPPDVDSIVVATAPDRVTLEVCKAVGTAFKGAPVWALTREPALLPRFAELGVSALSAPTVAAAALAAQAAEKSPIATCVGLRDGELLLTEILPHSSVVGKSLAALSPARWLVAAIYRDDRLVVPHGDTTFQEGDRVLLVGDHQILPIIARYLKTGHSEFPMQFGTSVAVPNPELARSAAAESAYLVENTRADRVVVLAPPPGGEERDLQATLRGVGAGVLVLDASHLKLSQKLGFRQGPLQRPLDACEIPILIPNGSYPYGRIMYAVINEALDGETASMAIDVARMFDAELTFAAAFPPEFVAGAGFAVQMRETLARLEAMADAYDLKANTLELQGNPVNSLRKAAAEFDLVVLGWKKGSRATPLRPSVETNLLHSLDKSVLVLPGHES